MSETANLEQMLAGFMFLELTDQQIMDVASFFGTAPLGLDLSTAPAPARLDNIDLDEVDVDNFTAVWRQITAPESIIIVERTIGGQRYMWTLLVGRNSCVEQVRGSTGFSWLCCSTLQILGRVLLNSGLLRESQSNDGILDPLPDATSWSVTVSVIADNTRPEEILEMRFGCEEGRWIAESEYLDRLALIDQVSLFLSNAIDEAANPTDQVPAEQAKVRRGG